MPIVSLPKEVLQAIFRLVNMRDLARLSISCKTFAKEIRDPLLNKQIYLKYFDGPNTPASAYNYEERLHNAVFLGIVLKSEDRKVKVNYARQITNAMKQLLYNVPAEGFSKNIRYISGLLNYDPDDSETRRLFLRQSENIWVRRQRDRGQAVLDIHWRIREDIAQIHCLCGITSRDVKDSYSIAASVVYDLREYKRSIHTGPFQVDGKATVDWGKVEAILTVLTYNLAKHDCHWISGQWRASRWHVKAAPGTYKHIPIRDKESSPVEPVEWDPYNVTGTWLRAVTYLDYNVLKDYNPIKRKNKDDGEPRPPLTDVKENIRLMIIEIKAVRKEDSDCVYFEGNSRSMHAAWDPHSTSILKGEVYKTKGGEVCWVIYSGNNGELKWRSVGIQVGGIKSARGVIGNWVGADRNPRGPVGPMALWKVSDDVLDDSVESRKHLREFFRDDTRFSNGLRAINPDGDEMYDGGFPEDDDDSDYVPEEGEDEY